MRTRRDCAAAKQNTSDFDGRPEYCFRPSSLHRSDGKRKRRNRSHFTPSPSPAICSATPLMVSGITDVPSSMPPSSSTIEPLRPRPPLLPVLRPANFFMYFIFSFRRPKETPPAIVSCTDADNASDTWRCSISDVLSSTVILLASVGTAAASIDCPAKVGTEDELAMLERVPFIPVEEPEIMLYAMYSCRNSGSRRSASCTIAIHHRRWCCFRLLLTTAH
uniref:Uncharacterized protein n=1 Tax=Anopheles culicifacies TaxID=139723 RepID=A0A182M8I1_9DIPT